MNKTTEALKLAEEALNTALTLDKWHWQEHCNKALAAIRAALAEPVREPVAWVDLTKEELHQIEMTCETSTECYRVIAKALKDRNSAPVQPVKQEPVAWTTDGECRIRCKTDGTAEHYAAPVDAKAIRAEALEEAAKVCDEIAVEADAMTKSKFVTDAGRMLHEGMWGGSSNCAAAIRGLK